MKRIVTLLFSGFMTVLPAISVAASGAETYTIESRSPSDVLTVSLTLPGSHSPQRLKVRGEDWGLIPQISNPRCGETALKKNDTGEWITPAGCRVVRWEVTPEIIAAGDINAPAQQTIRLPDSAFHRDVILLSEPVSLLRVTGGTTEGQLTAAAGIRLQGAVSAGENSVVVPAADNAPEFWLIGDITLQKQTAGNITVLYAGDNPEHIRRYKLTKLHQKALSYLSTIFPAAAVSSLAENNTLLVVWLGNDEKNRFIGGAAGHRSFIANYLYGSDSGENEALNNARTLVVAAHEQFHQLADISVNRSASHPVWIEEGLAQYYGLKALAHAGVDNAVTDEITAAFIRPDTAVSEPFPVLDARLKAGDRSVYPLFYTQGATFWSELDTRLKRGSGGTTGLDELVMLLLTTAPDNHGGLPAAFRDEIIRIGGEPVTSLLEIYVSQPRISQPRIVQSRNAPQEVPVRAADTTK